MIQNQAARAVIFALISKKNKSKKKKKKRRVYVKPWLKRRKNLEYYEIMTTSIIQIFVYQVCMNSLFYTAKLVESYKLYHTNRLCKSGFKVSKLMVLCKHYFAYLI